MPVNRIIITRHGRRLDSEDFEWTKKSATPYDSPLSHSPSTLAQVYNAGKHMSEYIPQETDSMYFHTSPFLRCVETVNSLSDGINQRERPAVVRVDSVFGEWLTPDYFLDYPPPPSDNHLSLADKNTELLTPAVDHDWSLNKLGNSGEYGESWEAMHARVSRGLNALIRYYNHQEQNSTIIIVTHGACCNVLLGHLLQQPLLSRINLASFYVMEKNSDGVWEMIYNSNAVEQQQNFLPASSPPPPVLSSTSTSSSSISDEVFNHKRQGSDEHEQFYFVDPPEPNNNNNHSIKTLAFNSSNSSVSTTTANQNPNPPSFTLQFSTMNTKKSDLLPSIENNLWKFGGNQV